jgi:hypothetical protein
MADRLVDQSVGRMVVRMVVHKDVRRADMMAG